MTFPPWEPASRLVKPLRKSVNPFGGDLCFGWLGSPRLYLYKPLGCVSAFWKWIPAVKQSGKFNGDKVHMSKRGSSLARRILHMVAINNLKVDKAAKTPVNPVIYDYYIRKCNSKKKIVAVGAVMHKICNIIFAMLRDNRPFKIITPQEHCEQYLAAHPGKAQNAA